MYSYHDTVPAKNHDLDQFEAKAKAQDDIILAFFKKHPFEAFTPFQVHRMSGLEKCPITSIRRSMTNLTKKGHLRTIKQTTREQYGRDNRQWTLVINTRQPKLF